MFERNIEYMKYPRSGVKLAIGIFIVSLVVVLALLKLTVLIWQIPVLAVIYFLCIWAPKKNAYDKLSFEEKMVKRDKLRR